LLDDHVVFGILEGVRRPLIRPTMQLGDSLGLATDEHGDPLQHRRRHKSSHRINTETATHRALQRKKNLYFCTNSNETTTKTFLYSINVYQKRPNIVTFRSAKQLECQCCDNFTICSLFNVPECQIAVDSLH